MLFSLFAIYGLCVLTKHAYLVGSTSGYGGGGWWRRLAGYALVAGILGLLGGVFSNPNLSVEDCVSWGLGRFLGFALIVAPFALIGYLIGRARRPRPEIQL